ncbi:hypothetical protein ACEWY4_023080 [Coilia grayii]|uniref:Fucosyltransferase n=1 Tax=Coilia grayii TaxID=363190 RepID=A0ABD1J207_9TELE
MANLCCHRRTILAVLLVCLTLFGNLLVQWPSMWNTFLRPKLAKSDVPVNITNTTILVWSWASGPTERLRGNVCKDRYGIPNCILTADRSLFPQADFVIFHNRELLNGQRLPLHLSRPHKQRWVWYSRVSPGHSGDLKRFAGQFNYTMSYRRDADFFAPYGWLEPHSVGTGMTVDDFIPKEKSSLACWVVSNFKGKHRRTLIYNKLKKVIPVDMYGEAVHRRLPKKDLLPTISHCYFYLTFENSIAEDYITEKLWRNAFGGGAVPVVLGPPRKSYEAMIPKDSFIHVDDFSSVEELGKFLKKLAGDRERYATYFKWKLNYTVATYSNFLLEPYCKICTKLTTLQTPKVYWDLQAWDWKTNRKASIN